MTGYCCKQCGQIHEGPPLGYDRYAPQAWYDLPATERHERSTLDDEACIVDGQYFFLKGNIYLPLREGKGYFTFAVWIALGRVEFTRALAFWKNPERTQELPYPGLLATTLQGYPSTLNLKTRLHSRRVGSRFYVEVERTNHPLALEHREGISTQRIQEIAEQVLHTALY